MTLPNPDDGGQSAEVSSDDKEPALGGSNDTNCSHTGGIPLNARDQFTHHLPAHGIGSDAGVKPASSPASSDRGTPHQHHETLPAILQETSAMTPASSDRTLASVLPEASGITKDLSRLEIPNHYSPATPPADLNGDVAPSAADSRAGNVPKTNKSMLGKLLDPARDGFRTPIEESDMSPSSTFFKRRPSAGATGRKAQEAQAFREDLKPKEVKDGKDGVSNSLKELVERHTPKLRRGNSQTSRKSDDGKSDSDHNDKIDKRSVAASATSSLLKKYGVCEKAAIGKGATAVVRLAHKWDRSTEKLYAVKEFRKRRKNETEKEYVKKLTSEFCISSTLHHENIVETVDLVQDESHHWCEVMEYCPGGDLYGAIKRGNLTSREVGSYFKEIVSGIAYLHSMGVAHRDIKPENLLLDVKGHVKITDFGVSDVFRMCWEKTTHYSKGLCGSAPYIAPEQFAAKEYDARLVDVWAAAIVLYCLYFQELPWREAKSSEPPYSGYVHAYASSSAPPPLGNIPREARHVVKRMLDPNPKTRAMTEEILKDKWFSNLEVVDTKPPGLCF